MSLSEILYKILIQGGSYNTILKGLAATINISVFSLLFGTLLGALICALRMSKLKILNIPAKINFQSCMRNHPICPIGNSKFFVFYSVSANCEIL